MSIERLFNHTVSVYREPNVLAARDGLGSVASAPALVTSAPSLPNARPNQLWTGQLRDNGPGEQQGAYRKWFVSKALDVRERDVIKVVSGPEAGLLLRVLSTVPVARRSVVHHHEVNVEVWNGELAE